MSFSYNPYKVMTIVLRPDGNFSWLCDSCGGGHQKEFTRITTIEDIRRDYDNHVLQSHRLTRDDVKDWHGGF